MHRGVQKKRITVALGQGGGVRKKEEGKGVQAGVKAENVRWKLGAGAGFQSFEKGLKLLLAAYSSSAEILA